CNDWATRACEGSSVAGCREAGVARVRASAVRLHDLRSDRGVPRGGVSGEDSVYVAVAAVSHRQWRFRWTAAADWAVEVSGNGEYLRRAVLPDDRGGDYARVWQFAAEGDARDENLGRGGRHAVTADVLLLQHRLGPRSVDGGIGR